MQREITHMYRGKSGRGQMKKLANNFISSLITIFTVTRLTVVLNKIFIFLLIFTKIVNSVCASYYMYMQSEG